MNEKDTYVMVKDREFKPTLNCLKNFPKDKLEFKPHEKSRTAKSLALGFLGEARLVGIIAKEGKMDFDYHELEEIADLDEIISQLEAAQKQSMEIFKVAPMEDLEKKMDFFGMDIRRMDALWFLLYDLIHHRGQFSVYLRLAGGKVPQIYGPSADEPMDKK